MDPLDIVRTYFDMINNGTVAEQAHTVLASDIEFITGTGEKIEGRDDYLAFVLRFQETLPDLIIKLLDHEVRGETLHVTLNVSGTFTGDLIWPDGETISANGKQVEYLSYGEFKFKDSKITYYAVTLDMQDFMSQLGVS